MGLSSKQVSSDGHDWSQKMFHAGGTVELPRPSLKRQNQEQEQQPSEQLKCPRCDSTNTKFCYYNNYNKSQPRHFCKACKRHWTRGGTLRNVPVGGGRKNKRLKASSTAAAATGINESAQRQRFEFPLLVGDEKALSEPPSSVQEGLFNFNGRNSGGLFMGSALSLPVNQDSQFPYSFESNPSSVSSSMQCSNLFTFGGESNSLEDTVMGCLDTSVSDLAWINPSTSSAMDVPINFGWDDIEKLVSSDMTTPWDDVELKP